VLQITLVEAWQRGRTFDPGRGSLSTWLLTIARSRAIDQLRRRVPEPQDLSAGELQDQGVEVHDEVDALLERWRIAGLLSRLAPEQAGLLRMRFHEELSQREIAARTGMPLGTVKMRMVQALERLRDLLDAEGAGDA
jgi:RNA polymerase sigma-70 factor (ECF subfamily)